MKILKVHERELRATRAAVGALIDTLAAPADALWPKESWPAMELDRPLGVGAAGGHGPIRYFVEGYAPGELVRFRFTGPQGFDGVHGYEIVRSFGATVVLRHALRMTARGPAVLSWPLVYRPLHDALIEDSLVSAAAALGLFPQRVVWSRWVRFLRGHAFRGSEPARPTPRVRRRAGAFRRPPGTGVATIYGAARDAGPGFLRPALDDERYLAGATDLPDLERRMRVLERASGGPAFVTFNH